MDMYRILENFDAVNSKQTLAEGQMKDMLHKKADSMSKEDFVADTGESRGGGGRFPSAFLRRFCFFGGCV